MKIKSIFPLLSIIFLIIFSSCSSDEITNTISTEEKVDPTWQFQQQIRATGKLILSNPVQLSFSIPGHIEELVVVEGDQVVEGEVLAKLDTSLLEQEVSQEESDLAVARANLARVLVGPNPAELARAESDLVEAENFRPLSSAQRTMQAADIAAAQANLDYLNSLPLPQDVNLAQVGVDRAQQDVDAAKARLERASLRSPIKGTITEVLVNDYEYINAGQTIVLLSDINDLSVVLGMDEIDVARISKGDEARVNFEALPGTSVPGVVTKIYPNSDTNNSRDFNVELQLLEIPDGLRWGMSAEATFE